MRAQRSRPRRVRGSGRDPRRVPGNGLAGRRRAVPAPRHVPLPVRRGRGRRARGSPHRLGGSDRTAHPRPGRGAPAPAHRFRGGHRHPRGSRRELGASEPRRGGPRAARSPAGPLPRIELHRGGRRRGGGFLRSRLRTLQFLRELAPPGPGPGCAGMHLRPVRDGGGRPRGRGSLRLDLPGSDPRVGPPRGRGPHRRALSGGEAPGADLRAARAPRSVWTGADLRDAAARGLAAPWGVFRNAWMAGADLDGADLADADLHGVEDTLAGARLDRARRGASNAAAGKAGTEDATAPGEGAGGAPC